MNQTASPRGLVDLRCKTNRELTVLIRRQIQRAFDIVQDEPGTAARLHDEIERLLLVAELQSGERLRLEARLVQLAGALACRRRACA
jgi:hypothetical protein